MKKIITVVIMAFLISIGSLAFAGPKEEAILRLDLTNAQIQSFEANYKLLLIQRAQQEKALKDLVAAEEKVKKPKKAAKKATEEKR